VIDDGVVVDVLRSGQDEQSFQRERSAFAFECGVRLVPNETTAETEAARGDVAGAFLMNLNCTDVKCVRRFAFDLRVIDAFTD